MRALSFRAPRIVARRLGLNEPQTFSDGWDFLRKVCEEAEYLTPAEIRQQYSHCSRLDELKMWNVYTDIAAWRVIDQFPPYCGGMLAEIVAAEAKKYFIEDN